MRNRQDAARGTPGTDVKKKKGRAHSRPPNPTLPKLCCDFYVVFSTKLTAFFDVTFIVQEVGGFTILQRMLDRQAKSGLTVDALELMRKLDMLERSVNSDLAFDLVGDAGGGEGRIKCQFHCSSKIT